MRSWLVLTLVAACGGTDATSHGPRNPPRVQVVGCEAATAAGVTATLAPYLDVETVTKHRRVIQRPLPTTVTGPLSAQVIRQVVRAATPRFKACGANRPIVDERMAISFTIGARGTVTRATTGTKGPLAECLVRVMRSMRFPAPRGGGTVTVSYPFYFAPAPDDDDATPEDPTEVLPWTPYAVETEPVEEAPSIARAVEAAMRARVDAVEACFARRAATGSLRALMEVDAEGSPLKVRVGGIGDVAVEQCVAAALAEAHVMMPRDEAVEVTCDLARGDAQPWRVTPDAGYAVIEATRGELRHGTRTVKVGAAEPDELPAGKTYLVLADADTPGSVLSLAFAWASRSDATLVAMRRPGAAPLLLGRASLLDPVDDLEDARVTLGVDATTLTACLGDAIHETPLADAREVGALIGRVAARCRELDCDPVVILGVADVARTQDLVEVIGSARRVGFPRVVLDAGVGCGHLRDDADEDLEDAPRNTGVELRRKR